jgi:histidinol dehydrogenase
MHKLHDHGHQAGLTGTIAVCDHVEQLRSSQQRISELETVNKRLESELEQAIELIIKELTKFHNKGLDANQSLENSIKSNWTGVFEPKNNNQSQFLTTDQKRRQTNANSTQRFLNKHGVENA